MPKLSRRLLVFSAAFLIVLLAPLAVFGYVTVRNVFMPPVAGTKFLSYDGLHLDGFCVDQPSTKGGQVLTCSYQFHLDSRFQVINHNNGAISWCVERVNDAHMDFRPPNITGPLLWGSMLSVPADWGDCTRTIPKRAGLYAELILKH
jgi:hypothetical protein